MSKPISPLDVMLSAARDRETPWDASRSNRVLATALVTRSTRARTKATRYTVATACGAILLLGFGIANGAGHAFMAAGNTSNASDISAHADPAQDGNSDGARASSNGPSVESEAPSPAELAALAGNDGGYGRD